MTVSKNTVETHVQTCVSVYITYNHTDSQQPTVMFTCLIVVLCVRIFWFELIQMFNNPCDSGRTYSNALIKVLECLGDATTVQLIRLVWAGGSWFMLNERVQTCPDILQVAKSMNSYNHHRMDRNTLPIPKRVHVDYWTDGDRRDSFARRSTGKWS